MINTLYLPEIREMLAAQNDAELREFCTALHPARTAEFMEGLEPAETWAVLQHTDDETRADIYHYFDLDKQIAKTFRHTGAEVVRANNGKDLRAKLQEPKSRVITAVINKFAAALAGEPLRLDSGNIFVFVDEGHTVELAENAAEARATQTQASKTGVGASIALNIGETDTYARVGDEAKISGADDVSLKAASGNHMTTAAAAGAATVAAPPRTELARTISLQRRSHAPR